MLGIFAVALFTSAVLLFSVQPMSAKMLLPRFGGTPAVWNTCMVFYQTALFAGYVYAHFTAKWFGIWRQAVVHVALLALAAFSLPVAFPEVASSSLSASPVTGLLTMLLASLGLPLFLVSATAPMLQKWFTRTGHGSAHDPYFLYAASNLGSMSALIAYPVLIEPFLPLREQTWSWAAGFVVMGGLIAACALVVRAQSGGHAAGTLAIAPSAEAPRPAIEHAAVLPFSLKLRWLALSFVPSSLLLGVTNFITTDITAVPLLWVVPLSLYLLTFVIVFSRRPVLDHAFMLRAQALLALPVALLCFGQNPAFTLLLHLAAFFASAMVCHGELARSRPSAANLTEFYIWMSAGGILGGAFNALAAPVIFDSLTEYPLAIVLACLLRPVVAAGGNGPKAFRNDLMLPLLLFGLLALTGLLSHGTLFRSATAVTGAAVVVSALVCLKFSNRPLRFALGVGAVLLTVSLFGSAGADVIHSERSFFGILKVIVKDNGRFNVLYHGRTLHGAQSTEKAHRTEPLTYFHRASPIGQLLEMPPRQPDGRHVAVIGLGAGTLASYARAGERWTFYEIDPAVVRIAQDPRYFTFMQNSPASMEVVLGDARLSLAGAAGQGYDIIVLDAFSSDAIPVHLLTEEALRLYLAKLAPGGIIAMHISNRFLDLRPVLGNLARREGLFVAARYAPPVKDPSDFKLPSLWVLMARDKADAGALADDERWKPLSSDPDARPWTDDFSNIASVFRF